MVKRTTTKDLIAESLSELGASMPFHRITVQDIVDNCSVSKGTFYYHFRDKYELAVWMYRRDARAMFDEAMARGTYRDFQLACVRAVSEGRELYMNIIENTRGPDSMMLAIRVETFDLLSGYFRARDGTEDIDRRLKFAINYYAHATANMIVDWVRDDRGLDAEELVDWLLDCMPTRLKDALADVGVP